MEQLLRYWTGPLPPHELYPDKHPNPLLHWIIHPIKRRIAKYYLLILKMFFGLRVVAITGSTGKTTTKDLLYSILSATHPTVASIANITPTYNIPTSILRCSWRTRFLILEMGVEYPGDMDFYLWLAQPDIAIITDINKTHTYYLGDLQGVIDEKSKLITRLPTTAFAVLNTDSPHIPRKTPAKILDYGTGSNCYTRIVSTRINPDLTTSVDLLVNGKKTPVELKALGIHLAPDVAAAVTAASVLNFSPQLIVYGLNNFRTPTHRMQPYSLSNGTLLLDDSYNSNPLSAASALNTLMVVARLTGKTPVAVLGQMNELGQYETSAHEELGLLIKKLGIKHLLATGPATQKTITAAGLGHYYPDTDALIPAIHQLFSENPRLCLLLKASRSFHFETIVDQFASG